MLSLFLGAGFSRWASNLPLVKDLFDFDIYVRGPREAAKLERVSKLKKYWDYQNSSTHPEEFIGYANAHMRKNDREKVLWYVVRRLSDPFLVNDPWDARTRIPMIDEKVVSEIEGVIKARLFLDKCKPMMSGIITTNYDLLVEYALGTKGFNYGIPDQYLPGRGLYSVSKWNHKPITLTGSLSLAKLHGSINRDVDGYYSDGRRAITGKALVVAPVHEKRASHELQLEWNLAFKILEESSKLIVFGFAFNPYDQAVRILLRDGGKNLKSVLLINPTSKADIAKELWPNAHIKTTLPPIDNFHDIESWLSS